MNARRLDADGLAALVAALADPVVLERYRSKIVTVPGSSCCWWSGSVGGSGHGRFWLGAGRVMIAHRFGFALVHGVDVLDPSEVLGHRCDNPLCQRVHPQHLVPFCYEANRREWAIRKARTGSPTG